jgi:hypothetical protein
MEPGINSYQRQLTLMSQDKNSPWECWRWKRAQLPVCKFPEGFPFASQLESAGYIGREDLHGATPEEVSDYTGLSLVEAQRVLIALWGKDDELVGIYRNGAYYDVRTVTLAEMAERDESGSSEVTFLGDRNTLRLTLVVEPLELGSVLTVSVKTRMDSSDTWRSLATLQPGVRQCLVGLDREVKADWAITGSATFSVLGEAT